MCWAFVHLALLLVFFKFCFVFCLSSFCFYYWFWFLGSLVCLGVFLIFAFLVGLLGFVFVCYLSWVFWGYLCLFSFLFFFVCSVLFLLFALGFVCLFLFFAFFFARRAIWPESLWWEHQVRATGGPENFMPQGILISVRSHGGPHLGTKPQHPTAC